MKLLTILLAFLGSFSAYAVEGASSISKSSNTGSAYGDIGWFVICSFGVIALIFFLSWLLKRLKLVPGASVENFRILSVLAVGQKEKIILVKAGEEQLLIGVTSQNISLLHKLETPLEVNSANAVNFKKIMSGLTDKPKE